MIRSIIHPPGGGTTMVDLPFTEVADLLRTAWRVELIELVDETAPTTTAEVSNTMAERRFDPDGDDAWSSVRKNCYITNYQCHLPKLDDADVIEWESDRGVIERGRNLAGVLSALACLRNRALPA